MGLNFWHLIIILVIVLLLFGPQRLPGLGKSLGEAIRGFKKGIEDNEIDVTDSDKKSGDPDKMNESQNKSQSSQSEKEKEGS